MILPASCMEKGVNIRYNTTVEEIKCNGEKVELKVNGKQEVFDRVLVTLSPAQMVKLAPQLPEEYLKGLLEFEEPGCCGVDHLSQASTFTRRVLLVQPAQSRRVPVLGTGGTYQFSAG